MSILLIFIPRVSSNDFDDILEDPHENYEDIDLGKVVNDNFNDGFFGNEMTYKLLNKFKNFHLNYENVNNDFPVRENLKEEESQFEKREKPNDIELVVNEHLNEFRKSLWLLFLGLFFSFFTLLFCTYCFFIWLHKSDLSIIQLDKKDEDDNFSDDLA